jgi:hypothetical protein
MATRRKYKSPPAYRDGGRVHSDIPVAPDHGERVSLSAQASQADDDNPLLQALHATARAEELQRHQPVQRQPTAHEAYVDGLPVSDRKKAFLKANAALMRPDIAQVAARHYQEALQSGIADDSDEIEEHILNNTARDLEHQRALSAAARSTPETREVHHAAQALQREADAIQAESAPPDRPAPAPAPAARRSMPMTAPVSREVPSISGSRRPTQTTLSADEVQIAHVSFPHLSKAEAEWQYAKNRARMQQMKAEGFWDQGGG